MGKNKKRAYLKEIRSRHRRSGRQAKSRILDEFCAVCGYNRKYARPTPCPRAPFCQISRPANRLSVGADQDFSE